MTTLFPNSPSHFARSRIAITVAVFAALLCTTRVSSQDVSNLTGLPAYPNLIRAEMDHVLTIETLGHQCARLVASTFDALPAVELWYRRTLSRASETDLLQDEQFERYGTFSGIKLALGVDYVAIYQVFGQPTTIELHRCDWNKPQP